MRFRKKPNQSEEPDYGFLEDEAEKKRKDKRKYAWITLLNTVLIYGLYVVLINAIPQYTTVVVSVYLVALAIVSFGYVIYNRGFTRKNLTVEMLPPTWSEEEKVNYIEDGKRRVQSSKWCLTILIPLVATFFFDIFYLFIYQEYFAPFLEGIF